ncbi:MAG TPA: aminoglycoside phosphotransferase family protein, partial [Planctomycetes bacterium]|nr:aminoglycoside phosphotransferase family protein [Planctomycetota bacterium]
EPGIHRLLKEKTGIPVPAILAFDFSRERIGRDYLVMSRIRGEALSDAALSSAAMSRALEETGALLRELHDKCRTDKYGYLGEHRPMLPCDTWLSAFRTMWRLLVEDIRACKAYDADEAARVVDALERKLHCFDRQVESRLLHMDVWSQNILVDESGSVTGIVDWDRALWGDVEIEFAVLDYCGISTDAFWKGYGRERDESEAASIRRAFYYLYELQKYIVIRSLRGGRPQDVRGYKAQAGRILAAIGR